MRRTGVSTHRVAVLGPPGAGKSTLARAICETLSLAYIGIGERLRAAAEKDLRIAATLAAGGFVSDQTAWQLVVDDIQAADQAGGFVLDGFPRTTGQITMLDGLLAGACPGVVLNLTLAPELIRARIDARAGEHPHRRSDDTARKALITRQRLHREAGRAVLEAYQRRGIVHTLHGSAPAEQVRAAALALLRHPA